MKWGWEQNNLNVKICTCLAQSSVFQWQSKILHKLLAAHRKKIWMHIPKRKKKKDLWKKQITERLNTDQTGLVSSYPTLIIQTYLLLIYSFVQVGYRVKPRKVFNALHSKGYVNFIVLYLSLFDIYFSFFLRHSLWHPA